MILISIYLTGFILNFKLFKFCSQHEFETWEWGDVILALLMSVGSWLSVMVLFLFMAINYLATREYKPYKTKPPKWL